MYLLKPVIRVFQRERSPSQIHPPQIVAWLPSQYFPIISFFVLQRNAVQEVLPPKFSTYYLSLSSCPHFQPVAAFWISPSLKSCVVFIIHWKTSLYDEINFSFILPSFKCKYFAQLFVYLGMFISLKIKYQVLGYNHTRNYSHKLLIYMIMYLNFQLKN